MRRRGKEPRIVDPATHHRRYVSLAVAADFLECDRKTLNTWLANREMAFLQFGTRRKIEVTELVAFLQRHRTAAKAS